MANLLAKFRIDYSGLKMVQISDKPKESTVQFFDNILDNCVTKGANENGMYTAIFLYSN